jgi:hypothetical protein
MRASSCSSFWVSRHARMIPRPCRYGPRPGCRESHPPSHGSYSLGPS